MRRLLALTSAVLLVGGAGEALAATDGSTPASASVVRALTRVPARTLNAVGSGGIKANQAPQKSGAFTITKLHGAAARGKLPVLLAANVAWCDHCAADSWSLAVALSRFGTFRGLRQLNTGTYQSTHTGSSPLYDNLQGVSFDGARYSSKLLGLTDVTLQDLHGHPLQRLSRTQSRALSFDTAGFVPAFDVGGRYGFVNSGFTPLVLHGQSAATIVARITDGTTPIGQNIDGLANVFSAAICSATGGKPASVCRSAGVKAGAKVL